MVSRLLLMTRIGLVMLLTASLAAASVDTVPFTIDPNPVAIGTFFHGGTVRVRGTVAPGTTVVVVITGQTLEEGFNRKGRVGPFWATVGKVAIAGVPRLHLVASTAPVSTLLPPTAVDEHLLSLEALVRRAIVEPGGPNREPLLVEYLKLKQRQGVVGVFQDAVQISNSSPERSFEATIPWPATAPVGAYRVIVLHVRDWAVVRQSVQPLSVMYVGLPRFISHMAFDQSLTYGVFAVFIALGVGLVMGLLFKRGTAAH
jgi:Putative transmembrane protein (Alph_Pro_TM)